MKKNMILLVGVVLVGLVIGIPIVTNTHNKLTSTQWMVQDIDAVVEQYLQENFSEFLTAVWSFQKNTPTYNFNAAHLIISVLIY